MEPAPMHEPPYAVVLKMLTGSWVAQAVGAAARLRLADHVASGPKPLADIAGAAGVPAPSAARLLRTLASLGVFSEPTPGHYGPTPISECLRTGGQNSLRELAMAETDAVHWAAWGRFADSVRANAPMAKTALGMEPWDYYGAHPEDAAIFSAGMGNLSAIVTPEVLAAYDFSKARTIVDVGGAHGVLVSAILQAHAGARGVLLDLPHVIAGAKPALEAAGTAARVELVAGSFFERVPAGGDVYLLKLVLHDWDDDKATVILKACAAAMSPAARLLIVELMVPADNRPSPAQLMDLNMLVMLGGRERTEQEYGRLLAGAGLRLVRAIPTRTPFFVIEAARA